MDDGLLLQNQCSAEPVSAAVNDMMEQSSLLQCVVKQAQHQKLQTNTDLQIQGDCVNAPASTGEKVQWTDSSQAQAQSYSPVHTNADARQLSCSNEVRPDTSDATALLQMDASKFDSATESTVAMETGFQGSVTPGLSGQPGTMTCVTPSESQYCDGKALGTLLPAIVPSLQTPALLQHSQTDSLQSPLVATALATPADCSKPSTAAAHSHSLQEAGVAPPANLNLQSTAAACKQDLQQADGQREDGMNEALGTSASMRGLLPVGISTYTEVNLLPRSQPNHTCRCGVCC